MPRIPSYESSVGIDTGNTPEMGLQSVNAAKRSQAELVGAIENAEDTAYKIRSFREKSEASAYSFQALQEQIALSDEDIGFDSSRYEQEIDKIGMEAGKTITSQLDKEEFAASFQRQATAAKFSIRNKFRERELDASRAAVEYNRQQIVNTYAGLDDAGKITAVKTFKDMLTNGVRTGIFNQATANNLDLRFQEDVQKSVVNNDILSNPDSALAELKAGKDGAYPGISEQFRAESIVKAEAYSKKYKSEAEAQSARQIEENEDSIVTRMVDSSKTMPSEGEIVDLLNKGQVTPTFAKAVIDNLRSDKKVTAKTRGTVFNSIAADILGNKKSEKDIKVSLLSKNATGELKDEDFNILYTFLSNVNKETIDKAMPKKTFWQKIFNFGKDSGNREEMNFSMFKQYMQKVNSGADPATAVNEIISRQIESDLVENGKKLDAAKQQPINPPIDSGMMKMINPQGALMLIPISNIQKAEQRGFKRAE